MPKTSSSTNNSVVSCSTNVSTETDRGKSSHLNISSGVDLMNPVSRRSAGLAVKVETLDKHRVVTKASHPDVPLTPTLQLNPPTNVKPAGK